MADVKAFTAQEIATEIANMNHECDSIRCSATGMHQHAQRRRYIATIQERDARIERAAMKARQLMKEDYYSRQTARAILLSLGEEA
jgi:hypothetical protein